MFYVGNSDRPLRRKAWVRMAIVLAMLLGIWLWYGTIQPAYEKWGFRRDTARRFHAASTDAEREGAAGLNGRCVVFSDHNWLAVRYGESTTGAWALSIACDNTGQWYECDHRLTGCSRFHVEPADAEFELSTLATAADLPIARAMITHCGFHPVAPR